ncbi:PilZ domain-containing protein [Desulfovibrio mangrovi]|uniref:PilZ domain-containing protein n=1 Tax=Desulfovibrio mangrovi TaxID=2976983 RepID=UPI0022482EC3|nr:PilZ domain-containing protein [Desulfovibrio mangrovi]UZP66303.1 PilZ domain-containing protein [Desulfovibrio mangrovi]
MTTSHLERRKHSRLELKAYGFSHLCCVHYGGKSLEVHLIDISPGGARIRYLNAAGSRPESLSSVHFDTKLNMNGVQLNGLGSSVRWVNGDECGLKFDRELELAASDLQLLLNP